MIESASGFFIVHIPNTARVMRIIGSRTTFSHLNVEPALPSLMPSQHSLDFDPVFTIVLLEYASGRKRS